MAHVISFENAENNWSNGLPIGNGVMGAMAYFENGALHLPVNHYEVYYNIKSEVLPEELLAKQPTASREEGAKIHADYRAMADFNQPPKGEPFHLYRSRRGSKGGYGNTHPHHSHPATAELVFCFDEALLGGAHTLSLSVEEATVSFTIEKDGKRLSIIVYHAREDAIVLNVTEEGGKGLLRGISLLHPVFRVSRIPAVSFSQRGEDTVALCVEDVLPPATKQSEEKPFSFACALKADGASLSLGKTDKREAFAEISTSAASYQLIFAVFTQFRYQALPDYAVLDAWSASLDSLSTAHKAYWQAFFSRANISLPDKFLEKVWYVNQYALDCCSGKDGVMKHHACGLNGLWDVKRPNIWGSLWYWDVNIQASFAGVFSSNHLELGKVFSDGLLSYASSALRYAKEMHGLDGLAIDYPYFVYYCVWPWCAQYLWFQYEYSLDKDYLKNEAYPVFLKLCEFCLGLFEKNEKTGFYEVYPDISPEQGPLTHNSVSTVASVKYMLSFTLEAARILEDDAPILKDIAHLLENLAPYAVCEDTKYGRRFKDSDDAPDNLWIRHPGLLMPVFPAAEIDIESTEEERALVDNTIKFLEDNCEIGIFQGSWLSAASSRIGKGQRALRLLYERGIDHMLRSNGLTAEATERFMNFCLKLREPLYYPCMMEFTGEMLAAVNEMLLQSQKGVIRVFPALPDGDPEFDRMLRGGLGDSDYNARFNNYPAWRDVAFSKLLAKGAFEVSAEVKEGALLYIALHSCAGGTARVSTPLGLEGFSVYKDGAPVPFTYEKEKALLTFETEKGATYLIKKDAEACVCALVSSPEDKAGCISHTAYTKRRIFLGEDKDTHWKKAFDGFIRDRYYGNVRMANHTTYKFDFTDKKSPEKDYGAYMPRQTIIEPGLLLSTRVFFPIAKDAFDTYYGYGFDCAEGLTVEETGKDDMLLSDCITGTSPNAFVLELPRGYYEAFVISGSDKEATDTVLMGEDGCRIGGKPLAAGEYMAERLPIKVERDGKTRIFVSSASGGKWHLNLLFLNFRDGYGF